MPTPLLVIYSILAAVLLVGLIIYSINNRRAIPTSQLPEQTEMWIPFDSEWDRLVDLTDGDNFKIHWCVMDSWVNDPENKRKLATPGHQICRGYVSARDWISHSASDRFIDVGFRPACLPVSDTLLAELKEGERAVIGTLYMDGEPVKVPQKPTWDGDIEDYIPGATLEMREALPDPIYQVAGIRVGDAFIADRCLLKNISFEDIEDALF